MGVALSSRSVVVLSAGEARFLEETGETRRIDGKQAPKITRIKKPLEGNDSVEAEVDAEQVQFRLHVALVLCPVLFSACVWTTKKMT
ncbi:hypothetical protein JOB18_001939 [Solea senegalensis]|uniref:Uncharacterized protein n=1 Tax=Solea senegalensis TaxID=28829 RepID=A0AAV6SEF4_SOLSE|nr:hypothetical protein JOB18_001939 [Solea senegalensis]